MGGADDVAGVVAVQDAHTVARESHLRAARRPCFADDASIGVVRPAGGRIPPGATRVGMNTLDAGRSWPQVSTGAFLEVGRIWQDAPGTAGVRPRRKEREAQ